MKYNFVFFALSIVFLASCGGSGRKQDGGELVGERKHNKKWFEAKPYGMVKVNRGSFNTGLNDQDDFSTYNAQSMTVSVEPFWIDETEITNNEYRQFVRWVIDSTALTVLSEQDDRYLITEDKRGNPIDPPVLNWHERVDWADPEVSEALEEMYYPPHERFEGKRSLDVRKLKYSWTKVDLLQAAYARYNPELGEYEGFVHDAEGNYREVEDRSDFILSYGTYIYPDTLVWLRDFSYSYNEPQAKLYFQHPGFDEYPVVGVDWKQATAFAKWRTNYHQAALNNKKVIAIQEYRLPTEAEWEWAARGGRDQAMYPWGGPYTRTIKGCFMANFKPMRGNYASDGFTTTSPVGEFLPNDLGVYDMAGNVAEWTSSAYDESSYYFIHDLNPDYQYNARDDEPKSMKRKVIRGGSWKDVKHYLQVGARTYEYQDAPKAYIGFRCVRSYIGKD